MKKIGNWWIPCSDGAGVEQAVLNEQFVVNKALDIAFSHVQKFDNAIDIGTWIGDSLITISKKFISVKGFEANNVVYDCCLKNLQERDIVNCELYNLGISNKIGGQYFVNKGKTVSGWVCSVELTDEEKKHALQIKTVTLDSLKLTGIDFIKIDVDSHEGFLVAGGVEFFKNNSPVILIENKIRTHVRQDSSMPNPHDILTSLNYRIVARYGKADVIYVKD